MIAKETGFKKGIEPGNVFFGGCVAPPAENGIQEARAITLGKLGGRLWGGFGPEGGQVGMVGLGRVINGMNDRASDSEIGPRIFGGFFPGDFVIGIVTAQTAQLIGELGIIKHGHEFGVDAQNIGVFGRGKGNPLQSGVGESAIVFVIELAIIGDEAQGAAAAAHDLEADF